MKRMLNNTIAKNAKPQENGKPKKYTDGGGMYLLVNKVVVGERMRSCINMIL